MAEFYHLCYFFIQCSRGKYGRIANPLSSLSQPI